MEEHRTDLPKPKSISGKRNIPQPLSSQIHLHLTTLFPPKQKELVLKKLRRDPFTKLEREYYSRVVKKNKSLSQQRDQGNSDYTHKQKSLTFGDSEIPCSPALKKQLSAGLQGASLSTKI